ASAGAHQMRHHDQLRGARPPHWQAQGGARRRVGQRPEPHQHRGALPPRDRFRRQPDRLWWRGEPPEVAAQTRRGGDVNDLETLSKLNADYISSVQDSDTKRFDEMLSDDFLNTNPDSSLVDKAGFLKQIAPKAKISNLACHDVNIRVMGDF